MPKDPFHSLWIIACRVRIIGSRPDSGPSELILTNTYGRRRGASAGTATGGSAWPQSRHGRRGGRAAVRRKRSKPDTQESEKPPSGSLAGAYRPPRQRGGRGEKGATTARRRTAEPRRET